MSRLNRPRKNLPVYVLGFPNRFFFESSGHFSYYSALRLRLLRPSEDTTAFTYTAGISFTRRSRLAAVANKRNNQFTFFTPRTFTCRRMLFNFAQPKTFSISLRFFWLRRHARDRCVPASVSQLGHFGLGVVLGDVRPITRRLRNSGDELLSPDSILSAPSVTAPGRLPVWSSIASAASRSAVVAGAWRGQGARTTRPLRFSVSRWPRKLGCARRRCRSS